MSEDEALEHGEGEEEEGEEEEEVYADSEEFDQEEEDYDIGYVDDDYSSSDDLKFLPRINKHEGLSVWDIIPPTGELPCFKEMLRIIPPFLSTQDLLSLAMLNHSSFYQLDSCVASRVCFVPTYGTSVFDMKYKPQSLKVVQLSVLPSSVTSVTFGLRFNQLISSENLPPNISHLELGDDFNQPIDALPDSLYSLVLGYHFNQPIDALPASLYSLALDYCFNQPINKLPSNLRSLILGTRFNQPIDALPSSLLVLAFNPRYELSIMFDHMQLLSYEEESPLYINRGLTDKNNFFPTLDSFEHPYESTRKSDFNHPLTNLPAGLLRLVVGSSYKYPLDNLPPKLTHLFLDTHAPNTIVLPAALTYFVAHSVVSSIRISFPQSIEVLLFISTSYECCTAFSTLTNLRFLHSFYMMGKTDSFPTSLQYLQTGLAISNEQCDNLKNVLYLSFPGSFEKLNERFPKLIRLQLNLHSLSFFREAPASETMDSLPPSLTHITIYGGEYIKFQKDMAEHHVTHFACTGWTDMKVVGKFESLTHLELYKPYRAPSETQSNINLPTLTNLALTHDLDDPASLPSHLTHLLVERSIESQNFPQSLTHLTFTNSFYAQLANYPPNLTHLKFGTFFDKPVDNLPRSLVYLCFGEMFNQKLDSLPTSLTHLHIASLEADNRLSDFDQSIENLPASITHLTLLCKMNVELPDNILPNLFYLRVASAKNFILKGALRPQLVLVAKPFHTSELRYHQL